MSDYESDHQEAAKKPRRLPAKSVCRGCSKTMLQSRIRDHVSSCSKIAKLKSAFTSPCTLYRLRVVTMRQPYELIIDVRGDAPMSFLDAFLRDIWMECCNHLSSFACVACDEDFDENAKQPKGNNRPTMERHIASVFASCVIAVYRYDFGTTTSVLIQRVSVTENAKQDVGIFVLARNEGSGYNSPREGACGYRGPSKYVEKTLPSFGQGPAAELGDVAALEDERDEEADVDADMPPSYHAKMQARQRKQAVAMLKKLEHRTW